MREVMRLLFYTDFIMIIYSRMNAVSIDASFSFSVRANRNKVLFYYTLIWLFLALGTGVNNRYLKLS